MVVAEKTKEAIVHFLRVGTAFQMAPGLFGGDMWIGWGLPLKAWADTQWQRDSLELGGDRAARGMQRENGKTYQRAGRYVPLTRIDVLAERTLEALGLSFSEYLDSIESRLPPRT